MKFSEITNLENQPSPAEIKRNPILFLEDIES